MSVYLPEHGLGAGKMRKARCGRLHGRSDQEMFETGYICKDDQRKSKGDQSNAY